MNRSMQMTPLAVDKYLVPGGRCRRRCTACVVLLVLEGLDESVEEVRGFVDFQFKGQQPSNLRQKKLLFICNREEKEKCFEYDYLV